MTVLAVARYTVIPTRLGEFSACEPYLNPRSWAYPTALGAAAAANGGEPTDSHPTSAPA